MARQRREVVPKCSSHPNQELLFCETCDCVFCSLCTADGHVNTREGGAEGGAGAETRVSINSDHTVIPFSIAIKRMSEILLYKAKECTTKVGFKIFISLNSVMKSTKIIHFCPCPC